MNRNPERLLEAAESYDILDDPEVQKLVLAAGLSSNESLQESVEKALIGKSIQNQQYPFDTDTTGGGIKLGQVFSGGRFRISEEQLMKHLLAVGQSGSGKTTLFYSLMNEMEKPFWAFDLKQDYRHLVQEGANLLVLPWTELRFNPVKPPPGVPPRRWIQVFSEIFGHATALLSGSKNYLMKQLFTLYRLYNLFEQVSPPFPSLHELQVLIQNEKINYVRKQSNYRDTLLNRLEAMNLTAGTIFDCSRGYPVEDLLQRDVVFEFDGLSRDVQNFLMEILFAYVYEYRLAENHRNQGLNHLFFLDEGKRVFSVYKERQDASGIPEIDELTAKMREFGEGLVVADQEAGKLTESIKANTYTKVLLPTGDRRQFTAVAESMNLSERQMEFAQQLGIGEAIIQTGNRDPVPVKLNDYQLEKSVSDRELEKLQSREWHQLSHEPRRTTAEFDLAVGQGQDSSKETEIVDDPQGEIELSTNAEKLLQDILENPFKPLTQRYDRFSSSYKGNKAKNELVDEGVVIEREVKNGEDRKLLQLTEKGRDYVEDQTEFDAEHSGRGGVVHRFWQYRIREAFEEAGWTAELEMFDADVYVNMGNTELVVEVAMGDNQRELDHLKKHLETGFDTVWIFCRNQEILKGLKQRVEGSGVAVDRVVFRLLRECCGSEFDSV